MTHFEPGTAVTWLSVPRGGYGFPYPVAGVVVRTTSVRVIIRVTNEDGRAGGAGGAAGVAAGTAGRGGPLRTELLRGPTPGAARAIRAALRSGAHVYANGRDDPNGPGIEIVAVSVRKEGIRVRTVRGEWLAPGAVWTEEDGGGQ